MTRGRCVRQAAKQAARSPDTSLEDLMTG